MLNRQLLVHRNAVGNTVTLHPRDVTLEQTIPNGTRDDRHCEEGGKGYGNHQEWVSLAERSAHLGHGRAAVGTRRTLQRPFVPAARTFHDVSSLAQFCRRADYTWT